MTKFYFVRHGQTETNLARRFNGGRTDTPLTASGRDGAIAVGRFLATLVLRASMPVRCRGRKQRLN